MFLTILSYFIVGSISATLGLFVNGCNRLSAKADETYDYLHKVSDLQKKLETSEAQNSVKEEIITALDSQVHDLQSENTELKDENEAIKKINEQMSTHLDELIKIKNEQEAHIVKQSNKINKKGAQNAELTRINNKCMNYSHFLENAVEIMGDEMFRREKRQPATEAEIIISNVN